MRGLLVILAGPSGVGKSSLVDKLVEAHPDEFCESVSATTRAPRAGEVHGKDYFFLSPEQFEEDIKADRFAEHAMYQNRHYGTPREFLEHNLDAGRVILLDIDVQGMQQIIADGRYPVLAIFILPPSFEKLVERLTNRGTEDEAAIIARIERARQEVRMAPIFDFQVVNDNLDNAVAEIESLIRHARTETPGKS